MDLLFLLLGNDVCTSLKEIDSQGFMILLGHQLSDALPFTSLVGLISISYSSKVAIHLALLPSGFACVNMSLTIAEGTKTVE